MKAMRNPNVLITITQEIKEFITLEHIKASPFIRDLILESKLFKDWQLKKKCSEVQNGRR